MSDKAVPYAVDPWRMSLLLETARKHGGGGYVAWFVKRWVLNITKGAPLPGTFDEWVEATKEESDGSSSI